MPTNLRTLFDSLGIYWTDRGPNARRDHVNIKCPWCGDDPSEHLMVWEKGQAYQCHRAPQLHRGHSFTRLLQALVPGMTRQQVATLLNEHANAGVVPTSARTRPQQSVVELRWQQFEPATENKHYTNYLTRRGFTDPDQLCRRYDLRFSRVGTWAARLLIPLHNYTKSERIGWTGRAVRDNLSPRYYTETSEDAPIYMPRPMRAVAIIVEGPLDALKIAAATEQLPVSPIAVMGLSLEPLRIHNINQALRHCDRIYAAFDQEVAFPQYRALQAGLAFAAKRVYKGQLFIPKPFKDTGEMPLSLVTKWVATIL